MKLVIDGKPVDSPLGPQDRYGDLLRSAAWRPAPRCPRPSCRRQRPRFDPTPPNPGPCPTCGRERPNLVNTFATTGSRAPLGSYDVEV